MMKVTKLLSLILAIFLLTSLFAGCGGKGNKEDGTTQGNTQGTSKDGDKVASKPPLKITAVNQYNENPDAPKDATLLDITKQKIKDYVGREVEVEYQNFPSGNDGAKAIQYLQMQDAAGTMPDVVMLYDLMHYKETMDFISEKGLFMEFDEDTFRKYMPTFSARVEEYGMPLEDIVTANLYDDGKMWYLPVQLQAMAFPKLREQGIAVISGNFYNVAFRDDILTKIFPEARTEAEIRELYKQKGELTMEDIAGDIPIKNKEDLYDYLKKVQDLNLKVGDKKVIPGALCSSSQSSGSLLWSMQSVMGYRWNWPLVWKLPIEESIFMRTSPEWKDYLKWWNGLYNEKLVDPELFVMKDDQYKAKAINGEYAVMNAWLPIDEARKIGKERGYGFRSFPMFYPMDFSVLNNRFAYSNIKSRGVFFSSNIKEEDKADILKWADFHMSEEKDILAAWGAPDWYTGEAKDRRYKAEYKDLENWAVYGVSGEKDGIYYGLTASKSVNFAGGNNRQLQLNPFSLIQPVDGYTEAPYYVYARDNKEMLSKANIDTVITEAQFKYFNDNAEWYDRKGWDPATFSGPKFTEYDKNLNANIEEYDSKYIKTIVDKPENFEANYEAYQQVMKDAGIEEAVAESRKILKETWENSILPNKAK